MQSRKKLTKDISLKVGRNKVSSLKSAAKRSMLKAGQLAACREARFRIKVASEKSCENEKTKNTDGMIPINESVASLYGLEPMRVLETKRKKKI